MISPDDLNNLFTVGAGLAAIWAGVSAKRADKQTRNTGNGFAAKVLKGVEDIHEVKAAQQKLLDRFDQHIHDHAIDQFDRRNRNA